MTQVSEAVDKNCRPMATDLALSDSDPYPPEMVVGGPNGFAGECMEATNYASEEGGFVVRLWQSEAGVLQTGDYPYDEYFLVLEGHVIITNRPSGDRTEYRPGDTGMLVKGGDFTWDMPVHFKKQYVRVES